jgi:hypothetical protein
LIFNFLIIFILSYFHFKISKKISKKLKLFFCLRSLFKFIKKLIYINSKKEFS